MRPILLVEDDPDDEALTLRALARLRLPNEVVVVRDGAEALDFLFALGKYRHRDVEQQPALVLLDLKLPKVDGFEVMRQIRGEQLTRLVPVVLLTSSREQGDLLTGYGAGANGYVVKPVDFDEFERAVQQVGDYWIRRNETPPEGI